MKHLKELPDGELDILKVLWELEPPVTRSMIEEKLQDKKLAPSTIITFLARLCDKGYLRQEKEGRKNLYYPLISKSEYQQSVGKKILNRLFGGSLSAFYVSLSDSGITEEDKEELLQLLKDENK